MLNKIKNVTRALVQEYGTEAQKRNLWNKEFATGHWNCIEHTPGDFVYAIVEKHCRGGNILDLGCGSGNTASELAANSYAQYLGVDISDVAIKKAAARSAEHGRAGKNAFIQSDIFLYVPEQKYDLVLFRELIMYTPVAKIPRMLERYREWLKPGGVFVVRMGDRQRYANITDSIAHKFSMVEHCEQPGGTGVVLVFR